MTAHWASATACTPSTWCTTGKWGRIAVLKGLDITDITIKEAIATNRRLDQRFFDVISDLEAKV
jgi:hypothetical protein